MMPTKETTIQTTDSKFADSVSTWTNTNREFASNNAANGTPAITVYIGIGVAILIALTAIVVVVVTLVLFYL